MATFTYNNENFLHYNKPVRIISGAIHFFRTVPESWRDRLFKLKALGCNTVETYMPWNLHEATQGEFSFSNNLDIVKFIQIAQELELWVIVRPGPYICAEWEMGGLPAWLLNNHRVSLRCSNAAFLEHCKRYLAEVFKRIQPLLMSQGGPVIMVQVENEYGAFGNDTNYVQELADFTRRSLDVATFTCDQPTSVMLHAGSAQSCLATANFGSKAAPRFAALKNIFPHGPKMCAEFWCGWFDHWGGIHHTRSAKSTAKALNEILKSGGSVNFYMFHGGTNFGFMNGANCKTEFGYQPTVTSYDYDALLTESGEITEKYLACRRVLEAHFSLPPLPSFPESRKLCIPEIVFQESADFLSIAKSMGKSFLAETPLSMEECNQSTGFILYRTTIPRQEKSARLHLPGVRDRALVFVDGLYQGVIFRNDKKRELRINSSRENAVLQILVENMGRVNYGPNIFDKKGLLQSASLNDQILFHWETTSIPLTSIEGIQWTELKNSSGPRFFRAQFHIEEPLDTFVALHKWNKGVCFVNDHNLGRYWKIGPQKSLYLPASFLKKGKNEIVIFELHPSANPQPKVSFTPKADLGGKWLVKNGLRELFSLLF